MDSESLESQLQFVFMVIIMFGDIETSLTKILRVFSSFNSENSQVKLLVLDFVFVINVEN
jgi:hypothetical protein